MHRKIYLIIAFLLLSSSFGKMITADVSTSVIVPPNPSNYDVSISSSPTQTTYAPNSVITYTITYGNNINLALPLTINASWTNGTVSGDSSPSVDIADYVVGSGGNAYGGTPPVVDTQNQTITWSINSFPGNTSGQTVSFQLKTNSNYTGPLTVNFTTSANLSTTGITTPSQSVTSTYQYQTGPTPTPSPTPGPTNSPTPSTSPGTSPTPSPSPTPNPTQLTILSVNIISASQSSAVISTVTNKPASIVLKYGTSPNALNKSVLSGSLNYVTNLALSDLQSNTDYYFKTIAKDSSGNIFVSDIFTFHTSSAPNNAFIMPATFVAVSNNTIVSKSTTGASSNGTNSLVVTQDSSFDFRISLKKDVPVKKVIGIIRSSNILAASTLSNYFEDQIQLTEIQPGVFYGRITTPLGLGNYELIARITDSKGNVTEQKISNLRVVRNFQVLSKASGQPLEGARVLIYYLSPQTKQYIILPSTAISIQNPAFTNTKGEINLTLAQGQYKVLVSQIGYQDQEVEFILGTGSGDNYPQIYLVNKNIGISDVVNYVQRGINDVFIKSTVSYVDSITGSSRLYSIISQLSLLILIIITFFALFKKTRIPVTKLPHYLWFYIQKSRGIEHPHGFVEGYIKDRKNNLLKGAHVYLVNSETEEIVGRTITNESGHFLFKNKIANPSIIAMRSDYKTSKAVKFVLIDGDPFVIKLEQSKNTSEKITLLPIRIIEGIASIAFEMLLIISFLFELLSINSFGFSRTAPYLAISIFNLFIWIVYLRVKNRSIE